MHGDEMVIPSLKGARVLVVQNDPFVAADLDIMIDEAEGKVVALATSREDAVSLLDHEPIDIAICRSESGRWRSCLRDRGAQQTRHSLCNLPSSINGEHPTSTILALGLGPR